MNFEIGNSEIEMRTGKLQYTNRGIDTESTTPIHLSEEP